SSLLNYFVPSCLRGSIVLSDYIRAIQDATPKKYRPHSAKNIILITNPAVASPFPSLFRLFFIPFSATSEKINPSNGKINEQTNPAIAIPCELGPTCPGE